METFELRILGTLFRCQAVDSACFRFLESFQNAYAGNERQKTVKTLFVQIKSLDWDPGSWIPLETVPVHKSSAMPEWNIDAVKMEGPEKRIAYHLPNRLIHVETDLERDRIGIRFQKEIQPAYLGEAVFHICRSYALYLRPLGILLHASGVKMEKGAVLFCGNSLSGKTTLLLEMIHRFGGYPLCNDRAFLPSAEPSKIISWPGYISMCEGTILNYPSLRNAALEYENGVYPYKTAEYGKEIRNIFDKRMGTKRMYPMEWLQTAMGKPYIEECEIRTLVFPRVSLEYVEPELQPLDPAFYSQEITALMEEASFALNEDAFLPWHGLPFPPTSTALAAFDALVAAGVRFFRLRISPLQLNRLEKLSLQF